MKESEQAQAIAEIKAVLYGGEYTRESYRNAIHAALLVADAQAQKIKSMEANYRELAGAWFDEKEDLGIQIAEQAKEIERLKAEHESFVTSIGFQPTPADEYPRGRTTA